jgi:hypothetical protein
MQTKIILAIVIIAAAVTLVLAPALTSTPVDAKKIRTCTVGSSSTPCNDTNQGTPAARNTCHAGGQDNHPNCAGT